VSTLVQRIFGLDALALAAFVAIFFVELVSGIKASRISKETFSSARLSRFTLKMGCYLVMIALPFLLSQSFSEQGKTWGASIFEWLHTFLVVHIAFENIISVLENISVIDGKEKTFYIEKIRSFLQSKITP
jgi:phage-related holin